MELLTPHQQSRLQEKLVAEYAARRSTNPSYSQRAFGRRLGVSSGSLSEIIQSKRTVSVATAKKILTNLNQPPHEIERFFEEVKPRRTRAKKVFHDLSLDQYQVLSTWYYLALLNLLELPEEAHEAPHLATRLNLPESKIRDALDRLLRLGMIEQVGERYRRTHLRYQTTEDISNSAIKRYHQETLELSDRALREVPPELRDFSSILLKLHPKNLKKIKDLVRSFQDEISDLVEGDDPREIYHLNVHLYPVTQLPKHEESL